MTDALDEQARANAFSTAIDELITSYLAGGCPYCRFPRFRATCEHDTAGVGAQGTRRSSTAKRSTDVGEPLHACRTAG